MTTMNKDDIQPPGHKADFAITKVIRSKRMIVVDTHIEHATTFAVLGPITLHGDNVSGPVRFGHDGQYVRILIEVMATMDFDEALAFVKEKQNASVAKLKDLGEHFDIWREEEKAEEKMAHPLDELWKQISKDDSCFRGWTLEFKPGDTVPLSGIFHGRKATGIDFDGANTTIEDESEDEDKPEE